jgi:hypothetical protein
LTPPGASIVICRNPLRPADREVFEVAPGTVFVDWLVLHYPAGFGRPIVVTRNGLAIDLAEADFAIEAGDVVGIFAAPGEPVSATVITTAIITAVITAAATAAITIALNLIFGKPRKPKGAPSADPIYSISGSQNAARVGDPIPALYGRMITTPDYASQPYAFFSGNDQYLDQILCVGWGEFDLHDVKVGETPASALEGDALEYWLFNPAEHGSAMGAIETLTGVYENVVTSPEVADQELSGVAGAGSVEYVEHVWFSAPNLITFVNFGPPAGFGFVQVSGSEKNNGNYTIAAFSDGTDTLTTVEGTIRTEEPSGGTLATLRYYESAEALTVGPFITCAPGKVGDRLMLDFVFPQGLYEVDEDTGDLLFATVALSIEYQQVADDGATVGGWSTFPTTITRNTNTPQRVTLEIDVPPARYRVRILRTSPPPSSARFVSNVIWTGLKFRLVEAPAPVYGAVALLVVRIRATNGIAGAASTRISAEITRRLPVLGSGPLVASTSPADAFVDIYTNPLYGARRPLAEVDIPELARLVDHWGGEAHFNAGFAQRSTIWEALQMSLQVAGAAPLPLGQLMSVAQEGVRALRSQLFSDANIIRGSLTIGYNFDRPGDYDGVRVEYRDPQTWNPAFFVHPPGALDADLVELFGCTDPATAGGFARLMWNKRLMQRKTANFDTELEGLIPRLGDRVALATDLPRWARAGIVTRADGLALRLDAPIDWSGSGHVIVLRSQTGTPSAPIAITPGPGPAELVLAAAPPFPLFGTGRQEPTHYAIATTTSLIADFTVANIEHRGGARVALDLIAYNPAVFAGTLPWMESPV